MPLLYGPTNSLGSLTIHSTVLVRTWSVRDNLEKKVNNGSLSRGRANGENQLGVCVTVWRRRWMTVLLVGVEQTGENQLEVCVRGQRGGGK